jgi:hypothetical protein
MGIVEWSYCAIQSHILEGYILLHRPYNTLYMLGTSNKLVPEVAFDFGTNFLWLYQKNPQHRLKADTLEH